MLIIYGSDLSSPSNKVRFVANYLGLAYEYRIMNLRGGEQKEAWFLKINPIGKVPAINDDGFCLFESAAICKYLCDKAGETTLYPRDIKKRAIVDQWCDFVALHVMVNVAKIMFNRVFAARVGLPVSQESIADGLKFLDQNLPHVERQLTAHPFVTGDTLSLADLALLSSIDPCEVAGIDMSKFPQLMAWQRRLMNELFYTKCYKEYGEILKAPKV